jgi:hypothetical protein
LRPVDAVFWTVEKGKSGGGRVELMLLDHCR